MPYAHDLGTNALMCVANNDHQTYQKKDTGTKWLRDSDGNMREVDIVTQREVTELAPITDQATALATVSRAMDLGLFPGKDQSAGQLALLAQVALAYRLDPLMGEIMPYQGRPYITIAGRRRLDNVAGHAVSISFRPPTPEEEAYYVKVGAIDERDVIQICVGHDVKTGATVEGFGRVLAGEGKDAPTNAQKFLPTVQRKIEMAQKRGERRMREEMFGPVAKPLGLEGIEILHEGDEPNVVEGTARVVEEDNKALDQGDLGSCTEHGDEWFVTEDNWGKVRASHKIQGTNDWCRFAIVEGANFQGAFAARFGEYKKPAADAWLKDNFNGKTWSKMEPREMLEARTLLTTITVEPPVVTEPVPDTEPSQPPPGDDDGPETDDSAVEDIITQEQLDTLLNLADCDEVSYYSLILRIQEVTGQGEPGKIPPAHYDSIVAWVNGEIDQAIAKEA